MRDSRLYRLAGVASLANSKRCIIGVLTSGEDSQGMNAAIRSVVRTALYLGCRVYFIKEGYYGMVNGGDYIVEASWFSVSHIISLGGTVIGSASCDEFTKRSGRLQAALNLVQYGIHTLVIIGGPATMTSANIFKNEWLSLLNELVASGIITVENKLKCSYLKVAGIAASIYNDFTGTDITIGTISALHRIIEQIDAIVTTATSHQRTFILDIIGRRCGYLALVAGIANEADYVFFPEIPAPADWDVELCKKLSQARAMGQRLNIIIIAEGSTDVTGKAIKAEVVKDVVVKNLKQDTKITVLGHVQRGGSPSARDRIMGTRMGAFSVLNLTNTPIDSEAFLTALDGNEVTRVPLTQCVEKVQLISKALDDKKFDEVTKLRGLKFEEILKSYKMLSRMGTTKQTEGIPKPRIAIMHIGLPCSGMNAAVHAFVRSCLYHNCSLLGIYRGIDGLIRGEVKPISWSEVSGIVAKGGAFLGTRKRTAVNHMSEIAGKLEEFEIDALLIIGGFEAFITALQLTEMRARYSEFNIPICVLPATICNNVPGTDVCIGTDTALNEITTACDKILQSAEGTTQRVFIVETMGSFCGYLATMGGIASGADAAYIFEEDFKLEDIIQDIKTIRRKMKEGHHTGLILKTSKANNNYTSEKIFSIFSEEGRDLYSTKLNILGHIQQGGRPTATDRTTATNFATKAADWIIDKLESSSGPRSFTSPDSAVLLGIYRQKHQFTPVQTLKNDTNFEYRLPLMEWWLHLTPLLRTLSAPTSLSLPRNPVEFLNTLCGQFVEEE